MTKDQLKIIDTLYESINTKDMRYITQDTPEYRYTAYRVYPYLIRVEILKLKDKGKEVE